jgi:hypothetical protein
MVFGGIRPLWESTMKRWSYNRCLTCLVLLYNFILLMAAVMASIG